MSDERARQLLRVAASKLGPGEEAHRRPRARSSFSQPADARAVDLHHTALLFRRYGLFAGSPLLHAGNIRRFSFSFRRLTVSIPLPGLSPMAASLEEVRGSLRETPGEHHDGFVTRPELEVFVCRQLWDEDRLCWVPDDGVGTAVDGLTEGILVALKVIPDRRGGLDSGP